MGTENMRLNTQACQFEIKSLSENGTFSGYGSVYETVDQVADIVHSGAFEKSISSWKARGKMPPVLWSHNPDEPIGVYTDIKETPEGLWVEGRLLVDQLTKAREVHALMQAGAIDGLSIGYAPIKFDSKGSIRHLHELKLYEVSIVTFPAHEDARVSSVKSEIHHKLENGERIRPADWEKLLREAGLSKSQATAFVSHGYKSLDRSDSDDTSKSLTEALNILRG